MRSVHVLRRSGWTKEQFPVGARIVIEASPDRADPTSCYLQTITFADGTHMDRYGQYTKASQGGLQEVRGPVVVPKTKRELRRPTGEPNITGDWAAEQFVMVNPKGTGGGLVPLGQLEQYKPGERSANAGGAGRRGAGAGTGPRLYGGTELTPAGEQAAAAFKREDNPRFRCETTSITLRLGVRRSREPDHTEQGHHRPRVRPDGPQEDDLHEPQGPPGEYETNARRALDRPLGKRRARRRYGWIPSGRAERTRTA